MLAQNFKSAADLGLTEKQKEALMKTLVFLETGKLQHVTDFQVNRVQSLSFSGHFNMQAWSADADCGTVRCIGGTAEYLGGVRFEGWHEHARYDGSNEARLYELFSPPGSRTVWNAITEAQAATALRSYLTTGEANWEFALA